MTDSVQGLRINSWDAGDKICKDYYGPDAKFADFRDGYYLDYMNGSESKSQSIKAGKDWRWA
jgi:hypothetical protein